jgi:hypothetical protein
MSVVITKHTSRRPPPRFQQLLAAARRLPAIAFLCVAAAGCSGNNATEMVLPTIAALPTENVLPPDAESTRIANAQTPAGVSDLSSAAVNDTVTFIGTLNYDSASGIVTVQTDDGVSVQLIIPPPMAESFNGQRVQVSGQVTDTETLTVNLQNIAAVSEIEVTLPVEVTQDVPPIDLPPELSTSNAPASFTLTPNLSALESYDAVLESQADALEGYELVSISNEVGVWRIMLWKSAEPQGFYELVIMPDGSVQPRIYASELEVTFVTVERGQVTIDSDDFTVLLRENQLDNPPYTIILSASEQATTWSAIDAQGQVLLTVNAITGEVIP